MEFRLDKLDKKILQELSGDSRQPVSNIARKLRLSKNTVLYRINALRKEGIIIKYQTIVDISKTGLNYGRLALKLVNNSMAHHKKVISFLKKDPGIGWIGSANGRFDILFVFFYKEMPELINFIGTFQSALGDNIELVHMSILERLHIAANNVIFEKIIAEPVSYDYSSISCLVDDNDRAILACLQDDSSMPILSIAQKTGLSSKTVLTRIRALEKKKVILRYSIVIDYQKLGYESYHLFINFHNRDHTTVRKFISYLLEMPRIEYATQVIGGASDFECDFIARNQHELYHMANNLKEEFPELVKSFEPLLLVDMHETF